MKIKRIVLKNYRGIRQADVTLADGLNTLVGKNNAGKSNFIDAILFARDIARLPPAEANFDSVPFTSRGGLAALGFQGRQSEAVSIDLYFSDPPGSIGIEPSESRPIRTDALEGPSFHIWASEQAGLNREVRNRIGESTITFPYGGPNVGVSTQGSVQFDNRKLWPYISKVSYLAAERRAESSINAAGGATLDATGANLLQVLNDLASKRRRLLEKIILAVRQIIPEVSDVIAGLAPGSNSVTGTVFEEGFPEFELAWSQLASGTRQAVLLMTFALSAPDGSLLLIEEPELFLHTQSIWKLLTAIGLDATDNGKQVIISSHSPVVIELVGLRNCLLTIRGHGNEGTTIEKLDEYAWLDDFLHKHGFMIHALLAPTPGLRILPRLVLLVEDPEDVIFWDEVLARQGLSQDVKVLHLRNGGWTEAIKAACLLKHLKRIGMAEVPQLVVIEEDDELEEKKVQLDGMGLEEEDYAILHQHVEAYFISAPVFANALGVSLDEATNAIANTPGRPSKSKFRRIVETLTGRPNIANSTRRRFAESLDPLPDDILSIIQRITVDMQI